MKKTIIILSFVFLWPGLSFASGRAYIEAPREVALGTEFEVRLLLNTDQPTNAYVFTIEYGGASAQFLRYNTSRSIISLWQKQPQVFSDGKIQLSGGSFTPFVGEKGEIISLRFRALAPGEYIIAVPQAEIYLANGKGTREKISASGVRMIFSGEARGTSTKNIDIDSAPITVSDTEAPIISEVQLTRDPFNTKQKLLGFIVRDDGSGVVKNEVRYRSGLFLSSWTETTNPAALPMSAWDIELRSIDNEGNSSYVRLKDWPAALNYRLALIFSILLLTIVLVYKYARKQ